MSHFTPWASLLGGGLIGLAALVLAVSNGRVAGVSGILGALPGAAPGDRFWRLAFLAGLVGAAVIWAVLAGVPAVSPVQRPLVLVAAGVLVGFGTRLGGGCTSGHGVCGLARLSRRSVAATATFLLVAAATVFVTRHLP